MVTLQSGTVKELIEVLKTLPENGTIRVYEKLWGTGEPSGIVVMYGVDEVEFIRTEDSY